jgi:hypothetical protein
MLSRGDHQEVPIQEPRSPVKKRVKPTSTTELSDSAKLLQANLAVLFIKHATTEDDQHFFYPPTFTANALSLIKAVDNNLTFQQCWRPMHAAAKESVVTSPYALISLASQNFNASVPLVKKVLTGLMYSQPLGRLPSLDTWKFEWCLAHFATPSECDQHRAFIAQERLEFDSDLNYPAESIHSAKRELSLYLQGHFDSTIDNILQCVANFIVFAKSLVLIPCPWKVHHNNPIIINMLIEMSNLILNEDTKSNMTVASQIHPHLLFTIFGYYQDTLAQIGRLLKTGKIASTLKAAPDLSQATLDASLFVDLNKAHEYNYGELKKLLDSAAPPAASRAFAIVHPPATSVTATSKPAALPNDTVQLDTSVSQRGRQDSTARVDPNAVSFAQAMAILQQSLSHGANAANARGAARDPKQKTGKGDWLEMSPGVSHRDFTRMPNGLRFCLHHAIKGITCNRPKCNFAHCSFAQLSADHKKLLETHLNAINQPTMKFKVVP